MHNIILTHTPIAIAINERVHQVTGLTVTQTEHKQAVVKKMITTRQHHLQT